METASISCLITGATGTIGKAIAMAMAQAGFDCICHYHTHADLAGQLAGQIVRLGRKAMILQADLLIPQQIEEMFQKARPFGHLRVLINSAAVFFRRPLAEISPQTVSEVMGLNFTAPLLASRYFIKSLAMGNNHSRPDPHPAKIINLVDIGGSHPWAGCTEYCASKAALIAATKSLARELAPEVTVNAVAPGVVTWPEPLDTRQYQQKLSSIPMGRFAQADEIAKAVLFLVNNDYITGQTIQVDGGKAL